MGDGEGNVMMGALGGWAPSLDSVGSVMKGGG